MRGQIVKPDGSTVDFETTHTFSPDQVEWFKAGSALNIVRQKVSRKPVLTTPWDLTRHLQRTLCKDTFA